MEIGAQIGGTLGPGSLMILSGALGAGKTVFAKGVAAGLSVPATITSPTYTIVSEYSGRLPFYHVDLYRIDGEDEFIALGLDDIIYGSGVALIEWPERAGDALESVTYRVTITILADGSRSIDIVPGEQG